MGGEAALRGSKAASSARAAVQEGRLRSPSRARSAPSVLIGVARRRVSETTLEEEGRWARGGRGPFPIGHAAVQEGSRAPDIALVGALPHGALNSVAWRR